MKRILVIAWTWMMCIIGATILSGCQPTLVDLCEEQTTSRILRFREYCYDASGRVKLSHQEGDAETEWIISITTDEELYTIFHQLTGLTIQPTASPNYSYQSEDHRYVCRLAGDSRTKNNRIASLYLWVEGCPEIEVIHFIITNSESPCTPVTSV